MTGEVIIRTTNLSKRYGRSAAPRGAPGRFIRAIENDSENELTMQNENPSGDFEKRQAAFDGFMQYAGRLPADFDYKKELAEYREERYGNPAGY